MDQAEFASNFSSFTENVTFQPDVVRRMFKYFDRYYYNFIVYVIVGGLICLFGVISNLVCLAAIFTYPALKHRGNLLVGNFVFVNTILSAFVYPVSLVSLTCRRYCYWPNDTCQWTIFYYVVLHSLTWQECILALNRFVAIVLPYHYRYIHTRKAIYVSIVIGYSIPLVLNVVVVRARVPTFALTLPFGGCLYNEYADGRFQQWHAVIGVYIPMMVVGLMYVGIFVRVGISRVLQKPTPGGEFSVPLRRRLTLAKMLFSSFIWYCLTYLPQPIATATIPGVYIRYPTTYFYIRWALFAGAGANAVIYALTNKDYRHGMLFVLRGRKSRQLTEADHTLPNGSRELTATAKRSSMT